MSLVLKASADATDDYRVMHGELEVGQIYRRRAAHRAEAQWLWALNGVPTASDAPALTGLAATLDEAVAALKERWSKWLASSELMEKVSGS
jgi:hypothetical protein